MEPKLKRRALTRLRLWPTTHPHRAAPLARRFNRAHCIRFAPSCACHCLSRHTCRATITAGRAVPAKKRSARMSVHPPISRPTAANAHPAALRHGIFRPCRLRCQVACVTTGSPVEGYWLPRLMRRGVSRHQDAADMPVGHLLRLSALRQPAHAPYLAVRGVLPRWHVPPPCQGARSWLVPFHSPRAPYGFP